MVTTMKKRYIFAIFILGAFYSLLYFWNKGERENELYPAIHNAAVDPDDYLIEAQKYEALLRHDKSAYSIEKAIQAIWRLEKNMDDESFDRLEKTIERLESVHRHIMRDSVPSDELLKTFEYALGNLAHAELEVAERYAASNQPEVARTALRYAQLHIKNALLFHNPGIQEDSFQLAMEARLFDRMDQLLKQENLSHEEYTASLDELIKEVDLIISQIE